MLKEHEEARSRIKFIYASAHISGNLLNPTHDLSNKVIERFRKEAAEEIKDERFIVPQDLSQTKLLAGYGCFLGFHHSKFPWVCAPQL